MEIKPLNQRDLKWKDIKLGFSTLTIGTHGCTITALASILGTTPDVINEKLKSVKGFSGAEIIWAKISEAFPQVLSATRHWSYNNDIALKNIPLLIEVSGEKLNNPRGKHWVVFTGNKQMMDPWTGITKSSTWYGASTGMATIELQDVNNSNDNLPELPLDEEKRLHEETRTQLRAEIKNHNETKADYEQQKTITSETKKELNQFIETLAGKLTTIADKNEIIGSVDRLLTLEDQLNQANKVIAKQEQDYKSKEKEWETRLSKLEQDLKDKDSEIKGLREEVNQVILEHKELKREQPIQPKRKPRFSLLQWLRERI